MSLVVFFHKIPNEEEKMRVHTFSPHSVPVQGNVPFCLFVALMTVAVVAVDVEVSNEADLPPFFSR
jgi:hypothetical protein